MHARACTHMQRQVFMFCEEYKRDGACWLEEAHARAVHTHARTHAHTHIRTQTQIQAQTQTHSHTRAHKTAGQRRRLHNGECAHGPPALAASE